MFLSTFNNNIATVKHRNRINVSGLGGDPSTDYGDLLQLINFFFNNPGDGSSELPKEFNGTTPINFTSLTISKDKKQTSVLISGDNDLKKQFLDYVTKVYKSKVKVEGDKITYTNDTTKLGTGSTPENDVASQVRSHMFTTKIKPYLAPALNALAENVDSQIVIEEINRIKKLIKNA